MALSSLWQWVPYHFFILVYASLSATLLFLLHFPHLHFRRRERRKRLKAEEMNKAGNQNKQEAEQNQKEIERQAKVRILYLAWFVRANFVEDKYCRVHPKRKGKS